MHTTETAVAGAISHQSYSPASTSLQASMKGRRWFHFVSHVDFLAWKNTDKTASVSKNWWSIVQYMATRMSNRRSRFWLSLNNEMVICPPLELLIAIRTIYWWRKYLHLTVEFTNRCYGLILISVNVLATRSNTLLDRRLEHRLEEGFHLESDDIIVFSTTRPELN